MRKSAAAVVSVAWGVAVGGTFGCLLPYLLGEWHFHRPLPYWAVAQAAGGLLICAGLVPIVQRSPAKEESHGPHQRSLVRPSRAVHEDRLPPHPVQLGCCPCSSRATPSSNRQQPSCTVWTRGS